MDDNENLLGHTLFHLKHKIYTLCHLCSSRPSTEAATTAILKIMGYLDGPSRSNCRLVCHAWKKVLDEEIGLRVVLNEKKYLHDNGAFCRSTRIERLTVEHLDTFRNLITLNYPDHLKMLNCTGPIDPDWFKSQLLLKCRNLVRVDLSGRFLQSQQLCEQPCMHCSSSKICHFITFPHLKSLIISYSHADYEAYHNKVKGSGPLQAIWGCIIGTRFEAMYFLKQVIDTNVTFILETVRSLQLQTLYISVDGMEPDEDKSLPGWTYRWKHDPLKAFLEAHRLSLRRLYLPHFRGDTKREDKTFTLFPCDLSTLEVSLIQKGDRKNTRFMEKLLLVQTELEELRLEKLYVGHALTVFPSLVSLLPANASTLTFIHLKLTLHDQEFMNGRAFTSCRMLQTLVVERGHDHTTFRNVTELPKSLRHLRIHVTALLGYGEPAEFRHFSSLDTLILDDLLLEVTGATRRLELFQLIKNLLRLRQLDRLHIDTREKSGVGKSCPMLNSLILELRGDDEKHPPSKPFSTLQIHPSHQCCPGEICECRHFLDTNPLYRADVDPGRSHVPIEKAWCDEIVVKSNIFQQAGYDTGLNDDGTETEESGEPWCDFCFTLFELSWF